MFNQKIKVNIMLTTHKYKHTVIDVLFLIVWFIILNYY